MILLVTTLFFSFGLAKDTYDDDTKNKTIEEIEKTTYKDLIAKHIFVEVNFLTDVTVEDKLKEDVLKKVKIEQGKVTITDSELKKYPAKITFLLSSYKNPIIIKNGKYIPELIPTREGLSSWSINVPHFSSYTIEENTFAGTHENTTIWSSQGLGLDSLAVGVYTFNNNATGDITEDESYSENNGTLNNSYHSKPNDDGFSGWDTDNCVIGNCLRFDGTEDTVEVENAKDINFNENFSISYWVKGTNNGNQQSVYDSSSLTPRWEVGFASNGRILAHMHDGAIVRTFYSTGDETGSWINIIITFNRSGYANMYIDGTYESQLDISALNNLNNTVSNYIGSNLDSSLYFEGSVDELKLYQKILSVEEVEGIYGNESAGIRIDISNNVLNLTLDETQGVTAEDTSGNEYDGTLISYNRPFWNITGGHDGKGAYEFGNYGHITLPSWERNESTPYTLAFWAKLKSITDTQDETIIRFNYDYGLSEGWVFNKNNQDNLRIYNFGSGSLVYDNPATTEWEHFAVVYDTTNIQIYRNGTYIKQMAFPYGYDNSTFYLGTESPFHNPFNGTIDDVLIIPEALTEAQIQEIYTNGSTYKYYDAGQYTSEIYNATDYDPLAFTNLFQSTIFGDITGTSYSNGRAGDCLLINGVSWTSGTLSGNTYSYNNQIGTCFMFQLGLTGDGSTKTDYSSLNVTAYKVLVPEVTNLAIEQVGVPSAPLLGNCTFMLNDTDTGYVDIEWFINNVSTSTTSATGLTNNTVGEFTLSSGFVKNDLVKFSCTPKLAYVYGEVWGTTINSNEFTIQNSNFTISDYSPSNLNFYRYIGSDIQFSVTLTDIDNDATCVWAAETDYSPNVQNGTGFSFTPSTEGFVVDEVMIVEVSCTDGSYTNGMEWNMTFKEAVGTVASTSSSLLAIMILVCVLLVLFAAGTYYFENELKYVFFLMCALMGVVGLFIGAKMAEEGFAEISGIMWTLYYISGMGFFMLFVYVIWRFIEAYRFEDSKKPGLK